jgi:hypothetical protein
MEDIKKQISLVISELVKNGYDKNDIICVGCMTKNNELTYYAIVMPSFEQLILQETIFNTYNFLVYNLFKLPDWYQPAEERKLWCLKYDNLIVPLIQSLDAYWKEGLQKQIIKSYKEMDIIRKFFIDIGYLHYMKQKPEQTWVDKDTFFKQLTHAEKDALRYISQEIGASGTVSISKMIEKYPISRPVWNNLFKKVQEFNIGEIINRGVKGTHINITHPQLRYDMQNRKI